MPELILLVLLIGAAGVVLLLLAGLIFAYRAFRNPSETIPEATEHEADLTEYQTFMTQRPSVEEIKQRALDMEFDEKVQLYREMPDDQD